MDAGKLWPRRWRGFDDVLGMYRSSLLGELASFVPGRLQSPSETTSSLPKPPTPLVSYGSQQQGVDEKGIQLRLIYLKYLLSTDNFALKPHLGIRAGLITLGRS